jgi:NADH-quinone oxidoreductase subunit M
MVTLFTGFSIILGTAYSIWMFNRVMFGSLRLQYFTSFQDVSRREFIILVLIAFLILWMGIYPEIFLNEMHSSIFSLLEQLTYSQK